MGLKVQIDSEVLEKAQGNRSGLLIGFPTTPIRIVSCIPTPKTPPKVSFHRWAVEHAKLISPAYPGGVYILGTYTSLSTAGDTTSASDVENFASIARAITDLPQNVSPVVVCNGPKGRIVAKQVLSPTEGTWPADLKSVPNLNYGIVCFQTTVNIYDLQISFPVDKSLIEAEQKSIDKAIRNCGQVVVQLPSNGHEVITDVEDDRTLAHAMEWSLKTDTKKKTVLFTPQDTTTINSFIPIGSIDVDKGEKSGSNDDSNIVLSGSVFSHAVVMQDQTLGQLLQNIRLDLERSLKTRFQLLTEQEEENEEQNNPDDAGNRTLPVRLVAYSKEKIENNLPVSDYMLQEETIDDDVKNRFYDMLSISEKSLDEYKFEVKEKFATLDVVKTNDASHKNLVLPPQNDMESLNQAISAPQVYMAYGITFAIAIAFVAIIVKSILSLF